LSGSPTLADPPDDTDDADAADDPEEGSGAARSTKTTRASIDQQQDDTIAPPLSILPTDSQDAKIEKWNLWINHYWEISDCRQLIPENLLQRGKKGMTVRNRSMKLY
jgi:hypothetical protein